MDKVAIQRELKREFGVAVFVEDREYKIRPLKWYLKKPLLGLRKYFYIEEACDCDDFCTILKYEWLRRHLKDAERGQSKFGTMSYPALPVFKAKIEMMDGGYHWALAVVHETGVDLIERTGESIKFTHGWRAVVKIEG